MVPRKAERCGSSRFCGATYGPAPRSAQSGWSRTLRPTVRLKAAPTT